MIYRIMLVGGESHGEIVETDDPIGRITKNKLLPLSSTYEPFALEDVAKTVVDREHYTRRTQFIGGLRVQIAAVETLRDAEAWALAVGYEEKEP